MGSKSEGAMTRGGNGINPDSDLLILMRTGIGESIWDVFFMEEVEEDFRLNGGDYGQVGKGFNSDPFFPIEDFADFEALDAEDRDEYWQRLLGEDSDDPDLMLVAAQNALIRGNGVVIDGKLVPRPVAVAVVESLESAELAHSSGILPILFKGGGAAVML